MAVKLFNINISAYERNSVIDDYSQYVFFEPESGTKELILINLENRGHYNLIVIQDNKNSKYESKTKQIKEEIFSNKKENNNQKDTFYLNLNKNTKDEITLSSVGDDKFYYNNIFAYLKSLEKAKYIDKEGQTIIKLKLIKYPEDL